MIIITIIICMYSLFTEYGLILHFSKSVPDWSFPDLYKFVLIIYVKCKYKAAKYKSNITLLALV